MRLLVGSARGGRIATHLTPIRQVMAKAGHAPQSLCEPAMHQAAHPCVPRQAYGHVWPAVLA